MSRFIRITAPHFVAAVVPGERAAPIVKYMIHWSEDKIRAYCEEKGWQFESLYFDLTIPRDQFP